MGAENFLTVMLQALTDGGDDADHPSATTPTPQKPSPTQVTAPDTTSASLLLALLAPALPKPPAHTSSVSDAPSVPAAQTAQEKSSATETVPDITAASLLMALLAPPLITVTPPKPHKGSAAPGPVVLSVPADPPTSTQTSGEAKPAKPESAEKLPLLAQSLATKEPENVSSPTSGTSAANPSQRMSFLSERNEIAGRTEQKLPPPAISAVTSASTGGPSPDSGGKSSLAFSWHDAPSEPLAIIELSAKAAVAAAPVAETLVDVPVRATSAAPLERLEQMISREVVNVRQAGAQSLGVMVTLDSNTQLFLQLTTHNGLVQASVRCERGNFTPEDGQWAQLQQSLARQNVELLPMTGGSNLNFQHPSEQRSRQQAAREEWPAPAAAAPPAPPRKQNKEQNRSRKNWETWA
jgi:hypothetical protein